MSKEIISIFYVIAKTIEFLMIRSSLAPRTHSELLPREERAIFSMLMFTTVNARQIQWMRFCCEHKA